MKHPLLALLTVSCTVSSVFADPAKIPDWALCTVPTCLIACPAGDSAYTVVIRDFANNPISAEDVVVGWCGCSDFRACPRDGSEGYELGPDGCEITAYTGPDGVAAFHIRGGGTCSSEIQLRVYGIDFARLVPVPYAIASPDQNGDLRVDNRDIAIAEAKLGGTDPTADFDCDGAVGATDVSLISAHLGHGADALTPARPTSWGRLKILYR